MKARIPKLRRAGRRGVLILLCAGLSLVPSLADAIAGTCNVSASTVNGTNWVATNGTILCSGTYTPLSLTIPSGVTIYTVNGSSVSINATNWIEITGSLIADGSGSTGGANCAGAGGGSGGGLAGSYVESGGGGGGGGGYGCTAGSTNCGASGGYGYGYYGVDYGTSGGAGYDSNGNTTVLYQGSGGAGGECGYGISGTEFQYGGAGGNGGGAIALVAPQIQLDATAHVSANGSAGTQGSNGGGGGGGGSGGDIEIEASEILTLTSGYVLQVGGGAGASGSGGYNYSSSIGYIYYVGGGGGGGSGGRVKVVSPSSIGFSAFDSGGSGGASWTAGGYTSATGGTGTGGTASDAAVSALTVSASASPTAVTPGAQTTITATANNPSGYFLRYAFDCTGTGTSYSTASTTNTAPCSWATAGVHTVLAQVIGYNAVTLINGTTAGNYQITSATSSVTVDVGSAPTVTVTAPLTGNIGQSLSIQGMVTDSNSPTSILYAWNFGDGSTTSVRVAGTTNTQTHVYQTPGTYTVQLTVTDSVGFGNSSSATIAIAEVNPTVTIGTLPSPIHAGTAALFSASASSPSSTITAAGFTYVFAWGDGSANTTLPPTANNTSVTTSHAYTGPGTFMLTVTASDEEGGSGSQTVMVTVLDPYPTVALNASSYSIALDSLLSVTGTASSSYGPAESAGFTFVFAWGDGANTTLGMTSPEIASHSYDSPGTYTLTLTVTDNTGVASSATATVTVTEVVPVVTIGSIPVPTYSGTATTFMASATSVSTAATNAGFTYLFAWGDGTASTTVTASAGNGSGVTANHTYASGGTYTLTVTATDKFGGAGSKTASVTVYNKAPAVTVGLSPTSAAIEATITATVTATASYSPDGAGGYTFVVNWGDGTTNTTVSGSSPQFPTHVYDSPGTFTVSVSATDTTGVAGTATTSINISDIAPVVTIGTLTVPTYSGTNGTYSASATSTSTGATNAGFTYVFAWGDGTANTTISATAHNGSGVSTMHSYAAAGTYTLTVTATDKFSDSGTKTASVSIYNSAPAVGLNLSATIAHVETPVTATATASASYGPDGSGGFTFVFNWGDGSPTTTVSGASPQAPSHNYDVPGTYSVTVSVTDATGVAGTATKSITITDVAPTVTIGALPSPVYQGSSAAYSASAASPSNAAMAAGFTYLFSWGDGTSNTTIAATAGNGTGVSAPHTYATAGTYTLTVTATDQYSLVGSSTVTVTIDSLVPTVTLALSPTAASIKSTVTATATAVASNPADGSGGFTFVFNWGDGSPAVTLTGNSPQASTHAYDVPGTYTVSVSATDATNMAGMATKSIVISDVAPTVTIGTLPAPIYPGVPATFSASATSPSTAGTAAGFTYVFNWGDGSANTTVNATAGNSTGVSTTHSYATTGSYTLTVMATDTYGGTGTRTATVPVVSKTPVVGLSLSSTTIGVAAALTATATATAPYPPDGAGGFTFVFNWGDGSATTTVTGASPQAPTHAYDVPGTYTISVSATDATGVAGMSSASVSVTDVAPTVTIGALPVPAYAGVSATFKASATSPSNAATAAGFTYAFAWGDGTAATTVAATAGNGSGVTATHAYASAGTYTLTVTATDTYGSLGTRQATVTVYSQVPSVGISLSPTTVAVESTLTATVTATAPYAPDGAAGFAYVYVWGDGTSTMTAAGTASPHAATHAYDVPGTYTIQVTATDATGVPGTSSATVTVTDVGPTVTIGTIPVPVYASVSATFAASATSPSNAATAAGFTYLFGWGDGTTSTTIAAAAGNGSGVSTSHTYASTGSFTLTVGVTDKYGTSSTKTATVTVYSRQPTVGLSLGSATIPVASPLQATGTATAPYAPDGTNGFTFVFTWGDGATTTLTGASPQIPTHAYDIPGTYGVQLSVTDATGVASTATQVVTVTDAAPTVTIGTIPEPVHSGIASTFTASATSLSSSATLAGFTYVFNWGDSTGNTTVAATPSNGTVSTPHTYTIPGTSAVTYTLTVTVTDKYNGVTSQTASVIVYQPKPAVSLSESPTSLPVGATETATITASSPYPGDAASGFTAVIAWGDGNSSTVMGASPLVATHVYDTPGTQNVLVTLTDSTGVPATTTGVVTVTEVVPTVTFGTIPSPIVAATTVATFSASATSPSLSATQAGFTYVFNWGDGTTITTIAPTASNGTVSANHLFANPGTFQVSVSATDRFGGTGSKTTSVTVLDPTPTVAFGASTYSGSAGSPIQFTTIAGTPVTAESNAAFTWSYVWGDGKTETDTGTTPFHVSHTYDVGGTYTAVVTATDRSGTTSAPAMATVVVGNVAPVIVKFLHPNGLFGSPITLSVTVTDASMADTAAGFEIVWDFGDGTPTKSGMNLDSVSHTYAVPGTYMVTVTAIDENSLQSSETAPVIAADTVPVVTFGGNQTVAHNQPVTLTPTITPYDPAWTYTYAWTLGDGSTANTATVTHTYPSFGMYTVSLTVTDPYGTSGTGTAVLSVVDTPPAAANVLISPTNPSPQQALSVGYAYADADGDPESGSTIVWYLNGQAVPADNNLATIPASAVQRNQRWYAVVTPKDGYLFGAAAQSNTVLIGDPPPQALGVTLTPALPAHADTLQVSYQYSDSFGYSESGTTIAWTKNGVAQPTLANQSKVLPPLTKGDVWQATVTPSDGYAIGAGVPSAAVTVQDTAPVLGALPNVAEQAQSLLTTVSWMVSATDVDGDPLTFDCAVGANDLGSGPSYSAAFPIGTTAVTCTAFDGTLTTPGTFTVAIGDVPPVVAVTPSQTVNPGVVTLAANGMDPLGRPVTYAWNVVSGPSSVQLTGADTPSVTFTAQTAGAYLVKCTVSNGTEQASAETTVTVLQLAPLVNLGPGPRTMVAGETITLDGTHSVDPNGGTLNYQWAVTSGSVQLSSSSAPMVTVTSNVGGRATVSLTVSDGVESASGTIAIDIWNSATNPPSAPYALLGPDQTVLAGAQVTLDGTPSFDPNAHVLGYAWAQMRGPSVTLMQGTTAQPQFLAQTAGTYLFELTVSDGNFTSVATSMVTVLPTMGDTQPLAAIHPADSTAMIGGTTTLDGSASTASPGHTLTYQWTRVSGPYVVLSNATSNICSITLLGTGELVMQLVVNDGTFSSLPVQATIHATEGTQTAPTAVANGPTTPSYVGLPVALDGSGSADPNGLPLVYQWTQLSGGPAAIHGSETAQASFTPSAAGTTSFQLTVYDWIFSTSATTTVTVQTDNVPIAVAKGPPSGYVGDSLALDGTESHDPAGAALTYAWTQVSGPTVALQNSGSAMASFSPRENGTYVFQLTVSNGQFRSPPVTVTTQITHFPTLRGGCTSQPGDSWVVMLGLLVLLGMRRTVPARKRLA